MLKLSGPTDYIYKIFKQTNRHYVYKARVNPNSIKNLINVETTFKNIFDNLIQNITNLKICMT